MSESTATPMTLSPAAERMRRHRQRLRKGLQCIVVELRQSEIEALIRKKLLKQDGRNEGNAIRRALYDFLDQTLGREP